MGINNFKKLESEHIRRFEQNTERVARNLDSEIKNYRFIGSILELFSTTVISYFISMSGGDNQKGTDGFERTSPKTNI